MKLEFLPSGSSDCPLIRLFQFNDEEVIRLKSFFDSLSNSSVSDLALHEAPWIEQVNACQLYLRIGKSNLGVRTVGPGNFECVLTCAAWDDMACLVEPFCKPRASGYQWLGRSFGMNLLLTRD